MRNDLPNVPAAPTEFPAPVEELFFSPSTLGFYSSLMHAAGRPEDCVPITEQTYKAVLKEQSENPDRVLAAGSDRQPMLVDRVYAGQELRDRLTYMANHEMSKAVKAYGYPNMAELISFAEEPASPRLQADAKKFRAWRAQVMGTLYELFDTKSDDELNQIRRNPDKILSLFPPGPTKGA